MPLNRATLKSYAPTARREFIQAVTDRAKVLGLSEAALEPVVVQGDVAIIGGRPFPKDVAQRRMELEALIKLKGFCQVMEEVAYTWFNRFVALRFMELHDYLEHGCRVLSNPSGSDVPEILEKATSIDLPGLDKAKVVALRLAGDKDSELYRLLLVGQCNHLNKSMPFLFERLNDSTELLLPENLLQTSSPIRRLVTTIPEDDWKEIEIVGWLYQYYISEKKDQVMGKVVKSEDIPAATQLFTPNWIVKYMVQNTLGRKWLMTYPTSPIQGKMEFYLKPAEQEPNVQAQIDALTPGSLNPEELTFMDPACGSGHILVEAYDLFKQIYLERGYPTRSIPRLILEKNLFGLDIDDRAAQLARFAVLMKARADDRRILDPENPAKLNILAIQESKGLDLDRLAGTLLKERATEIAPSGQQQLQLIKPVGTQTTLKSAETPGVSKDELFSLFHIFKEAKTFGSLLTVPEKLKSALPRLNVLLSKAPEWDKDAIHITLLTKQAIILAKKYTFVITNPPYIGSKGQNALLKTFLKDNYEDVKSDIFSAFIVRCFDMSVSNAQLGVMSPFVWMFISSYEKLRRYIINEKTITSLIQLEYSGFDGATVPICSYTLENSHHQKFNGSYVRLTDFRGSENQAPKALEAIRNVNCGWLYRASASEFNKIPGSPIAYWASAATREAFSKTGKLSDAARPKVGLQTGENARFVRTWSEVSFTRIGLSCSSVSEAILSSKKWFPYNKGGDFLKWWGNQEFIVNWENDGYEIRNFTDSDGKLRSRPQNVDSFFNSSVSWSKISSGFPAFRLFPKGFIYDVAGTSIFAESDEQLLELLSFCNSIVTRKMLGILSPTLNFEVGHIASLPFAFRGLSEEHYKLIETLVIISKNDWDSSESSWNFDRPTIVQSQNISDSLPGTYCLIHEYWISKIEEVKSLETENNNIILATYNLEGVFPEDVPIKEVSLRCNPYYRYGGDKTDDELKLFLLSDTMKELISYSIGCMMGRYSLDEPGLIYAHGGNQGFDPARYKTFHADDDGIVPVMDSDWFPDDATNRFVEFLKVTWPLETLEENLKFVADSLDPKPGELPLETIRRFISSKFFKDHHLKVYKKRPIYWLFSSGKHKAFECLVYLHRYNEATLSRMRSAYVTPLQGKLTARLEYLENEIRASSSTSASRQFQKELDTLKKKQLELREFDDLLRHYADLKITLDLDDGVKVNYGKFGNLLAEVKAVTGESSD